MNVCGISVPFETLSPAERKITYVFLTRPPLYRVLLPFSLDLHVLSPPLTFALSQDQTLHRKFVQIFIAEDLNESMTQSEKSCATLRLSWNFLTENVFLVSSHPVSFRRMTCNEFCDIKTHIFSTCYPVFRDRQGSDVSLPVFLSGVCRRWG